MKHSPTPAAPGAAFADPVLGSQRVFRALLVAMAGPGTVHAPAEPVAAPAALAPAAARLLLTLADYETAVWLAPSLGADAAAYVRFHCGAPIAATPREARFAVLDAAAEAPELAAFDAGDEQYPDRSATVIVQCLALAGGAPVLLAGPGIRDERIVAPRGLAEGFWAEVAANHARYPLGIDLVLAAGDAFLALPRSTRTEVLVQLAEGR